MPADPKPELWNWARDRRHIATGIVADDDWYGRSFCGHRARTRVGTIAAIRRQYTAFDAQSHINRLDAAPLCKHCERMLEAPDA